MLLVIVGLAVVVTMMVTGKMNEGQEQLTKERQAMEAKQNEKSKVVYTVKDIPEGATITADALEEKDCEASKVSPDALQASSSAVGRVAKYGIPAGQIVSQHDMAPIGISTTFDAKIKEGQRAITFAVDNQSGVAGFVAPGSHVDIIGVVGNGRETKANPILSDVEVIAVGTVYQKSSSAGATPASSVTVALAPEDANKLIKGVTAGKLYLTLRSEKDHTPVAVVDVTNMFEKPPVPRSEVAALPPPSALPPPPFGGVPSAHAEPAPPPPPPLHEIELWSGSKKETLSVPKN